MKLAGAAYLIFLGVRAFMRRGAHGHLAEDTASPGGWKACLDGFLVGVTNPKTVVFLAAVLPRFANPSRGHLAAQMFILGAIFTVIALAGSAWASASLSLDGKTDRNLSPVALTPRVAGPVTGPSRAGVPRCP